MRKDVTETGGKTRCESVICLRLQISFETPRSTGSGGSSGWAARRTPASSATGLHNRTNIS